MCVMCAEAEMMIIHDDIFSCVLLQGNSKGLVVVTDGSGSLGSDYPKIPSGMDLSSAASGGSSSSGAVGNNGSSNNRTVPAVVATTTSPPGKRLKGMTNRKLSPSHNHNNTNNSSPADFHSSSRSTPPLISHNIPNTVLGKYYKLRSIPLEFKPKNLRVIVEGI